MHRLALARGSLGAGFFVFSVCVFIVGCAGKAPKQTPFMKSVGTVTLTTNELRLRAYEYESWFSANVQSTAHQIIDATREPRIQEAALLWKINAIPAMQKAIFQTDPLAALATAWGRTAQMARFFDGGTGAKMFGEFQPLAVDTSGQLESEIRFLMKTVIGPQEFANVEPVVEEWVGEHPILDLTFGSREIGTDLAALTASRMGSGGLAAVGQIEETARDIGDRLTVYFEQLPKQIRWNTELVLIEWNRYYGDALLNGVTGLDESHAAVNDNIVKLTDLALRSPELLSSQRDALLEAINKEGMKLLGEAVDTQRVETLRALEREREIILETLNAQREAATADLQASLAELEAFSLRASEKAAAEARAVVDHFFWRAFQLSLAVLVLIAIVWFLMRRTARSRPE